MFQRNGLQLENLDEKHDENNLCSEKIASITQMDFSGKTENVDHKFQLLPHTLLKAIIFKLL